MQITPRSSVALRGEEGGRESHPVGPGLPSESDTGMWAAEWQAAISRLNALWHTWEVLRLRPGTGIATWYSQYLDQQLPILLGARGPFYQCSETAHREP